MHGKIFAVADLAYLADIQDWIGATDHRLSELKDKLIRLAAEGLKSVWGLDKLDSLTSIRVAFLFS